MGNNIEFISNTKKHCIAYEKQNAYDLYIEKHLVVRATTKQEIEILKNILCKN